MAKQKFALPIRGRLGISSYFADMRRGDKHIGLDILPIDDTILFYMGKGTVLREGWHPVSGWYVWYRLQIWDNRTVDVLYAHLASRITKRAGQSVDVGEWCGTMGSTGNSTGTHLHLEVVDNAVYSGHRLDPKFFMEQAQLIDGLGRWK